MNKNSFTMSPLTGAATVNAKVQAARSSSFRVLWFGVLGFEEGSFVAATSPCLSNAYADSSV